jgi:hypothetical protein
MVQLSNTSIAGICSNVDQRLSVSGVSMDWQHNATTHPLVVLSVRVRFFANAVIEQEVDNGCVRVFYICLLSWMFERSFSARHHAQRKYVSLR